MAGLRYLSKDWKIRQILWIFWGVGGAVKSFGQTT